MRLTELYSHVLSIGISVSIHIMFLFLVMPDRLVKKQPNLEPIVIHMKLIENVSPKPEMPVPVKKVAPIRTQKAIPKAAIIEQPPRPLPGDRETAILAEKITPVYPKTALNEEWQGTVSVLVDIDEEGQVEKLNVLKSSGHALLDASFLRAIRDDYYFKPKRVQGKNKPDKKVVSYTYSLD